MQDLEDMLFDLYGRTALWPNKLFIRELRRFVFVNCLDVNSDEFKLADKIAMERLNEQRKS